MSTEQEKQQDQTRQQLDDQSSLAVRDSRVDSMMDAIFGAMAAKELHNFPKDKQEQWKLMSLATGPRCRGYDDLGNEPIALHYFFVHRIQVENLQSGEVNEVARCVFIQKDLSAYAFVSDGVARDFARILRTFGLGPFDGKLKFFVKQVSTRSGFKTYTLVPA